MEVTVDLSTVFACIALVVALSSFIRVPRAQRAEEPRTGANLVLPVAPAPVARESQPNKASRTSGKRPANLYHNARQALQDATEKGSIPMPSASTSKPFASRPAGLAGVGSSTSASSATTARPPPLASTATTVKAPSPPLTFLSRLSTPLSLDSSSRSTPPPVLRRSPRRADTPKHSVSSDVTKNQVSLGASFRGSVAEGKGKMREEVLDTVTGRAPASTSGLQSFPTLSSLSSVPSTASLTPASSPKSSTVVGIDTPSKTRKWWSGSKGAGLLEAPPRDLETPPMLGDVYRHIAVGQDPPVYQIWLRVAATNGRPVWKTVHPGYQRDDGLRLILTLKKKDPSWVKEAQYKKVTRAQQMALSEDTASVRMSQAISSMTRNSMSSSVSQHVSNSSCMTRGGNSNCLQTVEARGMGKGWSDAVANWLVKNDSSVPDFILGQWVLDNPAGIRSYPYSTDPFHVSAAQANPIQVLKVLYDYDAAQGTQLSVKEDEILNAYDKDDDWLLISSQTEEGRVGYVSANDVEVTFPQISGEGGASAAVPAAASLASIVVPDSPPQSALVSTGLYPDMVCGGEGVDAKGNKKRGTLGIGNGAMFFTSESDKTSDIQSVKLEKPKHVHIEVGGPNPANLHYHAGSKDNAEAIMAKLESSNGEEAPIERPRSSAQKSVHFAPDEPDVIPPSESYGEDEEEEEEEPPRVHAPPPAPAPPPPPAANGLQAVAIYDFTADGDDELTVQEGETLTVLERDSDEWWKCRNTKGKEGVVPASYVELVGGAPTAPPATSSRAAEEERSEAAEREQAERDVARMTADTSQWKKPSSEERSGYDPRDGASIVDRVFGQDKGLDSVVEEEGQEYHRNTWPASLSAQTGSERLPASQPRPQAGGRLWFPRRAASGTPVNVQRKDVTSKDNPHQKSKADDATLGTPLQDSPPKVRINTDPKMLSGASLGDMYSSHTLDTPLRLKLRVGKERSVPPSPSRGIPAAPQPRRSVSGPMHFRGKEISSPVLNPEFEFAQTEFSTHRTEFIFKRKVPVAQIMTWQKDAVETFRVIQRIMGDRERTTFPLHVVVVDHLRFQP
ncbi:hypothetical protein C8Q76DRAFT_812019 [Earliella scabrosa]|nr:hypothetical protein C8Q76DRAFT_812019 [Earliella scabrosa]